MISWWCHREREESIWLSWIRAWDWINNELLHLDFCWLIEIQYGGKHCSCGSLVYRTDLFSQKPCSWVCGMGMERIKGEREVRLLQGQFHQESLPVNAWLSPPRPVCCSDPSIMFSVSDGSLQTKGSSFDYLHIYVVIDWQLSCSGGREEPNTACSDQTSCCMASPETLLSLHLIWVREEEWTVR